MAQYEHYANLRTEYQVCQQGAQHESSTAWSFSAIFLGLSTGGLGFIIPEIFKHHRNDYFDILVTCISVGMLIILYALSYKRKRANLRMDVYYDRMREIEKVLAMDTQHRQRVLRE